MNKYFLLLTALSVIGFSVAPATADTTYTYSDGEDKTNSIDTSTESVTVQIANGKATENGTVNGANSTTSYLIKEGNGELELTTGGGTGRLHVKNGQLTLSGTLNTVAQGATIENTNWQRNSIIGLGAGNTGTLRIQGSGSFSAGNNPHLIIVGADSGTGTVIINGAGASMIVGDSIANAPNNALVIGARNGNGTVRVEDGASVRAGWINMASMTAAANGTLVVTGSGSSVLSRLSLNLGTTGTASVLVENGGKFDLGHTENTTQGQLIIGTNAAGIGTLTIDGAGSQFNIVKSVGDYGWHYIGRNGQGTINVRNNGVFNATMGTNQNRLALGYGKGTSGTLNIETGGEVKTNSLLNMANGEASVGKVNVKSGGVLDLKGNITIAGGKNSRGDIFIDKGTIVTTGTQLTLAGGDGSTGNITVKNEGLFDMGASGQTVYIGNNNTSSTTVTIDSKGVFRARSFYLYRGSSTTLNLKGTEGSRGVLETGNLMGTANSPNRKVNFDGGIIRSLKDGNLIQAFDPGQLELLSGGGYIDSNGFDVVVRSPFSGAGHLSKIGEGSVTLLDVQSYTGATLVEEGVLVLEEENAIASSSEVTLNGVLDVKGAQLLNNLSGTSDGAITTDSTADITVNMSMDKHYAGSITNSGHNLVKTGTGSIVLQNGEIDANQIQVTGGTLELDASRYINADPVAITMEGDSTVNLRNAPVISGHDVLVDVINGNATVGIYGTSIEKSEVIRADANGELSLIVGSASRFSGVLNTVNKAGVDIQSGGGWDYSSATLGGSAEGIGRLVNNGVVFFAANEFNNLKADSLDGAGTFSMNVDFSGGKAKSDMLTITGAQAARGEHNVHIYVKNGIEAPEEFTVLMIGTAGGDAVFTGTADIGMLTASLQRGDGGATSTDNWYLIADPLTPGAGGTAVLAAAGAQSMSWMTQMDTLNKRMGELRLRNMTREVNNLGGILENVWTTN